ncbi:MAG: gephyrin-like molybdotransferase Glp, partial [Myxococcota bacterium]
MPAFEPLGVERVSLSEALGRNAGQDVRAKSSLPPFSNSAMDGYAVRAEDLTGASEDDPRRLPLVGESRAGGDAPGTLAPGSTMRIFTGARIPAAADTVVPQEDAEKTEAGIDFRRAPSAGAHVRAEGSDLAEGDVMVPAGASIGPGEIGLLAAQRISALTVYRRPRVAILSTGDELRDISEPEEPGTIVNSNAYALSAQIRAAGGLPQIIPNVPDALDQTVEQVRAGLDADLLITCGGVSVGDYDLVKEAFDTNGIDASFWKVRVKPGKPLTFGRHGKTPVVGLPGNPVSAMVTFETFVRPGLRRMLGDPRPYRTAHEVVLTHPHRHSKGRPELARARVRRVGDRLEATMHRLQGSGSLPSMVGIDALVLLAAEVDHFSAGTKLQAILLRDEHGSETPPFDA